MQFRYVAFWFYWLALLAALAIFLFIGRVIASGLEFVAPSLSQAKPQFDMAVTVLTVCFSFSVFALALNVHKRVQRFYPARSLALTEEGISFDLPLGISGFVSWHDIASVYQSARVRGIWHVVIEFKHKLPIGPAGLERELDRLLIRGDHILPSGEEFLKAAQRYHAQATGRPEAAEGLGEPRQSIVRKLAWTFRRPAR